MLTWINAIKIISLMTNYLVKQLINPKVMSMIEMNSNIETACFEDYIKHLRENFVNLVEYREMTGTMKPNIRQVKEALFDEDPFVMFSASIAATLLLGDKSIYH